MVLDNLPSLLVRAQRFQIISWEVVGIAEIVERSHLRVEVVNVVAESERLVKARLSRGIPAQPSFRNRSTIESRRLPVGVTQLVIHAGRLLRKFERLVVIAVRGEHIAQPVQNVAKLERRLVPR